MGRSPPLLTPGHVGYVVKQVKNDDVIWSQQLQGLFHLGGHLLHGGLVGPPAPNRADDDLVASVCKIVTRVDGMTAADAAEVAAWNAFWC
jgi:hypothetical protein